MRDIYEYAKFMSECVAGFLAGIAAVALVAIFASATFRMTCEAVAWLLGE